MTATGSGATPAPSGDQHEIRRGDAHAVVVGVGGGLRTYEVGGVPVLDGYDVTAMADGARAQTLVPWPNRVQDGRWSWHGEDLQLSLTEVSAHNAIHGLVRWVHWTLLDHSEDAVTLGCTSYPQPGYPWTLEVSNAWSLTADGLEVETRILNRSTTDAPVAAGFHPYLTVGGDVIDTAVLHVPADTWLPTGEQQIPTGAEPVDGTPLDFRAPRLIGDTRIDHTFTDLHRDVDGRCRLRLRAEGPEATAREVTLWVDAAYPFLEVFTGDTLPDEGRRRQGLGVEPMSAPPNALVTGEGVVVLAPGETWTGRWGVAVR